MLKKSNRSYNTQTDSGLKENILVGRWSHHLGHPSEYWCLDVLQTWLAVFSSLLPEKIFFLKRQWNKIQDTYIKMSEKCSKLQLSGVKLEKTATNIAPAPSLLVRLQSLPPTLSWAGCKAFVFLEKKIHQPGLKSLHNEFYRALPSCLIQIAWNPDPSSLYLFIEAACRSPNEGKAKPRVCI